MYIRVYAPDGEPFDVSRDRADHLLLNCGWTQTPAVQVDAEEELSDSPKTQRAKTADAVDVSTSAKR